MRYSRTGHTHAGKGHMIAVRRGEALGSLVDERLSAKLLSPNSRKMPAGQQPRRLERFQVVSLPRRRRGIWGRRVESLHT